MLLMEEKILKEGKFLPGGIINVSSFLNHQIDAAFLSSIGREIARLYAEENVEKLLTIESSGIAVAVAAGMEMGIPVLFAKKHASVNISGDVLTASVHSFTHGNDYTAVVSREYLKYGERVLLVDDFLARGSALKGLISLCHQAGAVPVGAAIAIEKGFQDGGDTLRNEGFRVESLAIIDSADADKIVFRR